MTKESNEYVEPLCEDFWTEFINNTDLTIRPVGKISYYDQVFFDVRSKGKILAKVVADGVGATDKNDEKGVYVEVLLEKRDKATNKAIFDYLKKNEPAIKNELGFNLQWLRLNERKRSRIFAHHKCNPRDEDDWKNQHEWVEKTLKAFIHVFPPYLKSIT